MAVREKIYETSSALSILKMIKDSINGGQNDFIKV